LITLLIEPEEFEGDSVEIRGDNYKHLFRARRLTRGSEIRVVDGRGNARWSGVEEIGPKSARLELGDSAPSNEPEGRISLFVVPPKPQRLAVLVEKTTELGVSAIHLISSVRNARTVVSGEMARLGRISRSAVEQSHRSFLPQICGPHSWSDSVDLIAEFESFWVLDPTADRRPEDVAGSSQGLVVGPEGGFTTEELAQLRQLGGDRIGLGARILRTETAAIVGTALLLGD
jgi:16S rRNA (uracil1498-N3)-methyltransferase